jgi:hypothetical protein
MTGLPRIAGNLAVKVVQDAMAGGLGLVRTAASRAVEVAILHDGTAEARAEAQRCARLLTGAPAMLALLEGALAAWGSAVEDDEAIDGGDAVDWLAAFTTEVRVVLERMASMPEAVSP